MRGAPLSATLERLGSMALLNDRLFFSVSKDALSLSSMLAHLPSTMLHRLHEGFVSVVATVPRGAWWRMLLSELPPQRWSLLLQLESHHVDGCLGQGLHHF